MSESPPPPPEHLKPWYYQYWFLYPSFMFWPLWSILILRSPWHNGIISGAIAWAALFIGSYALYTWGIGGRPGLDALLSGQISPAHLLTGQIILPGILLTIITQTHWQRRRPIINAARRNSETPTAGNAANNNPQNPNPSRPAGRRSNRRRRKPR